MDDFTRRAREVLGAAIVRLGLKVAGFEPLSVEAENGLGGPAPDEGDEEAPIPPVELSPRARDMVSEAARETARRAEEAVARTRALDGLVEKANAPRRGSVAWRVEEARRRAAGG